MTGTLVLILEFFAPNIRNPHTRRAYYRAAEEFLAWCAGAGVPSIAAVQPVHVATWMPHPPSSNVSPRTATCSIDLLPARSCQSTRRTRCAGRATSSRPDKRRYSIPPKRARCSAAATRRGPWACATAP